MGRLKQGRPSEEFQRDYDFAAAFVDSDFIGRKLGQGLRARVYELHPGFGLSDIHSHVHDPRRGLTNIIDWPSDVMKYVIKIPRTESVFPFSKVLVPPSSAQKKLDDFRIAVEYLEPYIPITFILSREGYESYCIVQEHLGDFENITQANLEQVRPQLQDVFKRHQELVKGGIYLEMLGREGVSACAKALINPKVTAQMTNVILQRSTDPKVKIHDITLLKIGSQFHEKTLESQVRRFLKMRDFDLNRWLIAHHFGFEFGLSMERIDV